MQYKICENSNDNGVMNLLHASADNGFKPMQISTTIYAIRQSNNH